MIDNPGGQEEEDEEEMLNKTRSPCLRSLYRLHVRMFKPKKVELNTTEKVMELLQPVRYKPTSVAEMAEEWRLSRQSIFKSTKKYDFFRSETSNHLNCYLHSCLSLITVASLQFLKYDWVAQSLLQETKFSRSEVKFLYRAFKQECPNGIIDEETFKDVYENIFPLGDASKYAHLVFKCIDRGETGNGNYWNFSIFHEDVILLLYKIPV